MKNRKITGIILGAIAGIIDVTPMIIMKLTWDACTSAFVMWVICGFLLSITELKIHPAVKGILVSFLLLTPCAILIGWKEPVSLVPISIMTLVLGSSLGLAVAKLAKNVNR